MSLFGPLFQSESESGTGTAPASATQVEAEAGTGTAIRSWSPLRVWQSVAAKVASSIATLTLAYSSTVKSTQTVDSAGRETHAITDGTNTATVRIGANGALWLEQSGQTAGNARGIGAFDWQAQRNNASHVASGIYSTAMGTSNSSSGSRSVAMGLACTASGYASVAMGYGCAAPGYASVAMGYMGNADMPIGLAIGGGASNGQHQTGIIPLGKTTTDATPTVLDLHNTATYRPVVYARAAWHFRAMCIAYGPSYKASAWSIEGVICRDGSNTTRIVGTPTITLIAQDTEMSGCAVTATADNTNESLAITVTGLAATSIRWTCSTFYSQTIQA